MKRFTHKVTTLMVNKSDTVRLMVLAALVAAMVVSLSVPDGSALAGWAIGGSY